MSKYRARCIGSGALMAAYAATGYLTGVRRLLQKSGTSRRLLIVRTVGLKWVFTETSPFPLGNFIHRWVFSLLRRHWVIYRFDEKP